MADLRVFIRPPAAMAIEQHNRAAEGGATPPFNGLDAAYLSI